jgi:hypothetical protein
MPSRSTIIANDELEPNAIFVFFSLLVLVEFAQSNSSPPSEHRLPVTFGALSVDPDQ